jgi:hypothetical protein
VGRVDWQNGRALMGDKIYVTGVDYTAEAKDWLWEIDVNNKKVQKYSLPQYVERVMPGDDELFLMFREGVYFTDKNAWGRWNISTQKLERLKFPEPVEYVYEIENQFFTIGFIDGMWVLKKRQENGELKLIYTFPEFLTLRKPELRKNGENLELTTKTYDYDQYAVKRFIFNAAELNFLRVENLISQKEVLSIAGECGGDLYQRPHDPHQVGFIEEKYFVDAKNSSLIQKVEKCNDYEKFGLKKVAVKVQEASSELKLNLASTEDHFYPRPFHFLPHFWYPDITINGKLSHVGAGTTVSDPRGDHTLSLGYAYAYNLKEHEPEFAYTNHQALALNHDFYSSVGYGKSYYRSSFSSFNESTENTFATLSLSQRFNSFLHFPALFLQKQRKEDFFSDRDQIIYGLQENFLLLPHKKNDLIGPLNIMGQYYRNDVDLYEDYNTFQTKLQWDIKPSWQSKIHLQGSYGKNYKNSYASGVLYAGGSGSDVVHEFYNVDNNNAYGNEMATWRVQYSHLLSKIYSGGSVFPLFVKDVSLFGGTERLYADNIYIKNHVSDKTQLQDIHGGARVSANVLYLASVEFELVASTLVGGVDHDFRLLTLINAGGF